MAARVSGLGVTYAAAGFVLLWSGYRNVPLKDTITGFATGSIPSGPPSGPPQIGVGPPATVALTPSGGTVAGGEPGRAGWASTLLAALGVPVSSANIASLVAWQAREGGGGANNPLNTTQPAAGSTAFNSVGVQNYPNEAEGISATVITLNNGLYNDILMYLRSGHGFTGVPLQGLSTWSGGGYSKVG